MKIKKRLKNSKKPATLNFKFSDLFSADYRIITVLLIILPLLIYAQVYNFEFVWDDTRHLKNPFLQNPSWASFTQLFTQPFFAMYIPVSYLFWGLLKALAELLSLPVNSVLHLSNVVVHIINGLLVFTIFKQFIANKWAVLLGVGFFLLHPIQVETVSWVSEFRGLLATLFALLSCYYYLKKSAKLSYLALIFFVLAALSKPSAVVLAPFVFLLNYFYYGFKLGKNIEKTLLFALIALVFVIIASSVQLGTVDFAQYSLAFWQRPFAWLDSIVFYLYKIIYPYHLSLSYALSPKFISAQWWFYPLALMPAGLGYFLWLRRKTQPLLIFAVALFVAGFFTTSGFVSFIFQKFSLVADRYIYFAMIGTALVVANLADRKYWRVGLLSVLLIFASLSAFRQIPIWQNKLALWSHSMNYEVTPSYAHDSLAVNFNNTGDSLFDLKQYNQAITYFDKAIKLLPKKNTEKLAKAFYNKGLSLLHLKKYQQALDSFNQAIKINPNNVNANNGKINALTSLVKHFSDKGREFASAGKHQQAIVYFDKAINITLPNNKKYLAILFSDKGRAFANMGKYQQAAYNFGQAIKHYPQDDISDRGTAFYNKGLALFKLKKQQQALEHFNQAIKINPTNAAAHNANIDVLIIIKQCKKAKQAYAFAQQHKIKLQEEIAKNLHKVCP